MSARQIAWKHVQKLVSQNLPRSASDVLHLLRDALALNIVHGIPPYLRRALLDGLQAQVSAGRARGYRGNRHSAKELVDFAFNVIDQSWLDVSHGGFDHVVWLSMYDAIMQDPPRDDEDALIVIEALLSLGLSEPFTRLIRTQNKHAMEGAGSNVSINDANPWCEGQLMAPSKVCGLGMYRTTLLLYLHVKLFHRCL